MKDCITLDLRSELDKDRILGALAQAMPQLKWRGGDSEM